MGITEIMAAGAKAIADGAAKAAASTAPKTTTSTTTNKTTTTTPLASKTVAPLPKSSQGIKLINQIIAGEKPAVEIKQASVSPPEPIAVPPTVTTVPNTTPSFFTAQGHLKTASQLNSTIVGIDVIGTPVTLNEAFIESKNVPGQGALTSKGKLDQAIKNITTSGIRDVYVEPTETKSTWGILPDQSSYNKPTSDVQANIEAGKIELKKELEFREKYPEYQKEFESNKSLYGSNKVMLQSSVTELKASSPESQWWLDLNQNAKQDADEFFSRDAAVKRLEGNISSNESSWNEYQDNFNKMSQSYQDVNANIPKLRSGLVSQVNLERTLGAYKQAGYKVSSTDTGITFLAPSAYETHQAVYGSKSEERLRATSLMSIRVPEMLSSAASAITGDKKYYNTFVEDTARSSLGLTKKPNEDVVSYSKRFWTSPEAIESTWVPLATMGAGYAIKGLSVGGKVVGKGLVMSKISSFGATPVGRLTNLGTKTALATVGAVGIGSAGISLTSTAIYNPERLPSVGGKLLSTSILAVGGYSTGSSLASKKIPTPMVDAQGRLKADVRLFSKDVQKSIGDTNIGRIKAYGESFVYGKEPGTGIRYRYELNAIGKGGKGIGPAEVIIEGENVNLVGKTLDQQVSRSFGKITKPGKTKPTAIFETYGKNTVPREIPGTKLSLTEESSITGVYGKNPDVFTTKGYSLSKDIGTRRMSIGNDMVRTPAEFDITARISKGTFESPKIKGTYTEIGESALFKGYKKGLEPYVKGKGNMESDLTGMNKLKLDLVARTATQTTKSIGKLSGSGKGGLETIGLSKYSVASIGTGVGITTVSTIKSMKITPMASLGSTESTSLKSISIGKTTPISIPKITQVPEIIQYQKTYPIQINKQIPYQKTGQIQYSENIPYQKVSQIQQPEYISYQKQDQLQMQKVEQLQMQRLTTQNIMKTPSYKLTSLKPFIPFFPRLSDEGIGRSGLNFGKGLGKSYRFRQWKVPKLESLLGRY